MLQRLSACCLFLWAALSISAIAQPVDKVVAAHYPPLMVADNADRPGYAVEILQEAARRAGRKIDITFLPFERAIFEVQNDPATLMPALFKGKKRDDLFHWVINLQMAELRFASTTGAVNDLRSARNLRAIVLETGTTGDVFLTEQGFTNVVRLQDPAASARMLESGRVDAWFLTEANMQRVWSALGASPDLVFGDIIHSVPISLVASPRLPADVSSAYRTAVQSMNDDGTLAKILRRYENN